MKIFSVIRPAIKTTVFLFLLCAAPAFAQQFNTSDGATYGADDSAFKLHWDKAADKLFLYYAPVGVAGNAILWSEGLTLDMDGNVGIGTTAPGYLLDLKKDNPGPGGAALRIENSHTGAGSTGAWIRYDLNGTGEEDWGIGVDAAGWSVYNYTDTAYRLTVDNAGKIGIGTTTPGTPSSGGVDMLHVSAATDTALMIESKGTAGPALVLYHNPADGGRNYKIISMGSANGGAGKLGFWDEIAGAYRMTMDSAGKVGIGTASPQSTLHVPDGKYAQFEDNNAGAPPAGDCDADAERGRMSIDTTNNRLYICNGATRGWDYVALTD